MPVVIQEFEAVTTPPPDPRATESTGNAPAPHSPREVEELLRGLVERQLRVTAD